MSKRVDGTAQRVRQDKAGVEDLRGYDSPRAGRFQSEERRTRTAARGHLGRHERLGIAAYIEIALGVVSDRHSTMYGGCAGAL